MKIHLYTLCWNEMAILPFVVDYWKAMGVEKVVVFDNGSTDGSDIYLRQFPFVEVRHFDSDGMNDAILRDIKNTCWKESIGKCDFVIVCDMDELLYSPIFHEELGKMRDGGYNVLGCRWHTLCEDNYPVYHAGRLLHTRCHKFYHQHINRLRPDLGKFILFDPNKVEDMGYGVGAHKVNVKPEMRLYETGNVFGIHIDKGFGVEYMIHRRHLMNARLSETNRSHNWCFEYGYDDARIRKEYMQKQAVSYDING